MLQKQAQKIDKVIGRNIRIHRLAKKMSQTELGEKLGVSFQQVQKYENGTNRVEAAGCIRSPRSSACTSARFSRAARAAGRARHRPPRSLAEPQSVRLIRAFAKITDNTVRRSLVQLAENSRNRREDGRDALEACSDQVETARSVMPAHSRSKNGVASLAYVAGIHV